MTVLPQQFKPTLDLPQLAMAQRRPRRNMLQQDFYNQQVQKPKINFEQLSQERQVQQPQMNAAPELNQQGINPSWLEENLNKAFSRPTRPELQPEARVRNPSEELVSPTNFQSYFDRLGFIRQIGQEAEAAQSARSAFQRMQSMFAGGMSGFNGGGGSYQAYNGKHAPLKMLGRVAPNARNAAYELSGVFGYNNIGGHATSGHIPGSDHYTGKAIDVMGGGSNVVNYALKNANKWKVKYIIFNRQYWEPGKRPVRYTGSNPHTGHVHISFY